MNMTVNINSSSSNATPAPTDAASPGLSQLYILLTTLFFSLIISAGLFGNSLVIATLVRRREMRTPCNLLMANIMCAADLGVCIFAAPLRIIENYRGWIFGDVICYILTPLQDVFVVVSVITHTVIALERHRAIVSPFKRKMTLKRVKTSVVVIWIACYLSAGVQMMIFLKNELYYIGYYFRFPVFSNDDYRVAYEIYLVVLFITFPLVIQCAAYFNIIRVLEAKVEIKRGSFHGKSFKDRVRQKKRLVRMLIVLMLAFQVCYLPRRAIMLMQEFTPETTSKPEFLYVQLITLAMFYLKHVLNTFLLWAMNNDFRSGCLRLCLIDPFHYSDYSERLITRLNKTPDYVSNSFSVLNKIPRLTVNS